MTNCCSVALRASLWALESIPIPAKYIKDIETIKEDITPPITRDLIQVTNLSKRCHSFRNVSIKECLKNEKGTSSTYGQSVKINKVSLDRKTKWDVFLWVSQNPNNDLAKAYKASLEDDLPSSLSVVFAFIAIGIPLYLLNGSITNFYNLMEATYNQGSNEL